MIRKESSLEWVEDWKEVRNWNSMWVQLSSGGLGRTIRRKSKGRSKVCRSRGDAFEGEETSGHFWKENIDCRRKLSEKVGGEGVLRREGGQLHLYHRMEAGEEGQVQVGDKINVGQTIGSVWWLLSAPTKYIIKLFAKSGVWGQRGVETVTVLKGLVREMRQHFWATWWPRLCWPWNESSLWNSSLMKTSKEMAVPLARLGNMLSLSPLGWLQITSLHSLGLQRGWHISCPHSLKQTLWTVCIWCAQRVMI